MKSLLDEFPNDVKVVFKQFPLAFHKDARPAAIASLAAHEQGKFWEMHDKLFANMKALSRPDLERYASEIGLDMDKFRAVMDSGKFDAQIDRDMAAGKAAGVSGTPTSFVNGVILKGASPLPAWRNAVNAALGKGSAAPGAEERKIALGDFDNAVVKLDANAGLTLGKAGAADQMVVFVDPEDRYTAKVLGALDELLGKRKGKLAISVQFYPLPNHKFATAAAQAVLAASKDADKAWKYLRKIADNADSLSDDKLEALAKDAGLDAKAIMADVKANKHRAAVAGMHKAVREGGGLSSPTIFMNGKRYTGLKGYELAALEAALDSSSK